MFNMPYSHNEKLVSEWPISCRNRHLHYYFEEFTFVTGPVCRFTDLDLWNSRLSVFWRMILKQYSVCPLSDDLKTADYLSFDGWSWNDRLSIFWRMILKQQIICLSTDDLETADDPSFDGWSWNGRLSVLWRMILKLQFTLYLSFDR